MRFITEFELTPDELKYAEKSITDYRKRCGEERLGSLISESFGWQERGETTLHGPVKERHTLEIEAFPMERWVAFKQQLKSYIEVAEKTGLATFNLIMVGKMLKELESFGKPSGDTITNPR